MRRTAVRRVRCGVCAGATARTRDRRRGRAVFFAVLRMDELTRRCFSNSRSRISIALEGNSAANAGTSSYATACSISFRNTGSEHGGRLLEVACDSVRFAIRE